MKAWRVDERINSVKNNDVALLEPVQDEGEGQGRWSEFANITYSASDGICRK